MAQTFYDLRKDAIEAFQERINNGDCVNEDYISDVIHEVAESVLPVYTSDILSMASYNFSFAACKPEY